MQYASYHVPTKSAKYQEASIVEVWVQLGPLGTAATIRPIVPTPGDYDDGETGPMTGRGNRSTRRKPTPVPLCPPETPSMLPASVGSQRLTAWATAQPITKMTDMNSEKQTNTSVVAEAYVLLEQKKIGYNMNF
jgi:hypothetical protein